MAYLASFGKYLPERAVSNEEIAPLISAEPDWIFEMSGIRDRRWAGPEDTVAAMGVKAAERALERAGVPASSVGVILVASGTSERRFPGPAAEIQHLLGATAAVAIDVPMASAGALFAMVQGGLWLQGTPYALVIASEKMSPIVLTEPIEKGTAMLFGDGAGAVLMAREAGKARVLDVNLGSDGSNAGELRLEFGAPLHMNGRAVIMHAARKVPASIQAVLSKRSLSANDLSKILMHQANANLINKIAQVLGVGPDKFYSNIARYGNTSSASLLIAAEEWEQEMGFEKGVPVVMTAFGAGFHWGAMLLEGC
jgi:3-oxoacyl-[acyl-carrier-protein] synthase-3